MKKVLYIVSNPFKYKRQAVGGNISSATGVINGFIDNGYTVDIVTDSKVPTLEKDTPNLKTIFYPLHGMRKIIPYKLKGLLGRIFNKLDHMIFQIVMKRKVALLLEENNYAFCYMRASYNGHAISELIKKFNIKLIVEVNKPLSMGPYNAKDKLDWPENGTTVKVPRSEILQYEAASLITVDSSIRAKWVLEFVDKEYKSKMIINPNGVNTKMFSPSKEKKEILNDLGFSSNDIIIGMASSFRWYNDIDELCLILKKANIEVPNLKNLIIVGDKSKETELSKKIADYEIENSTIILCQIPFEEMPKYLNCCDIFISHFNFHGRWPHNCSIKHLEYLSLGKPTIATNVGEVNFAIEHEENGLLSEEGNIDQFSDSIIRLANDKQLEMN